MTTKPPSRIKPASDTSLEKAAYAAVAGLPAADPHDLDRLGYNVWLWLTTRRGSLASVVKTAGVRLGISDDEAVRTIRASLKQQGIES